MVHIDEALEGTGSQRQLMAEGLAFLGMWILPLPSDIHLAFLLISLQTLAHTGEEVKGRHGV